MQQIAVIDYVLGCIDVYTISKEEDPQEWLDKNEKRNPNSCEWIASDGILPITIHA
jgi:hypothetical protein